MNRRGFLTGLAGLAAAGLARLLPGAGGVAAEGADGGTLCGVPIHLTDLDDPGVTLIPLGDHGGIPVPDDIAGPFLDEIRRQRMPWHNETTLADAITTATPGDTIYVWPGGRVA